MDEVYEARKLLEIFPSKRSIRFCTEQLDGLLSQDQQELSERVAHLEKRVREQENEIVCLKGALADVLRRLGQVETSSKSQNSILPSRPFKTPAPRRTERPKSQVIESSNFTPRSSAPSSARQTPRGASANTMKKWGSTEDTQKTPRPHSSSQLNHSKYYNLRMYKFGKIRRAPVNPHIKPPTWDEEDRYIRMHLKGRPVCLYAPSTLDCYDVKAAQNPPEHQLKLEWVYGYRGRDCRSNLYTVATGEVIYFSAAVVILHNFEEQTQRHYLEHTDDIKCIAIHPDQVKIATGQVAGHEKKDGKLIFPEGKKPHVRVWDSINLTTLHILGESEFQRGVCCVSFSKVDNGKFLLAVDESNDHCLSVWDVDREKKITESKSSGDPVTQCEFHPSENSIVCCGKSQISFWTLDGTKLDKKMGIFQKNEKPKVVICFCFTSNGDVVSGDSSGNIYIWEKGSNKISKAITNAHEGGVFSVCSTDDGEILSGGGKDRKIVLWDKDFKRCGNDAEIPEEYGAVRMISRQGSMILVGTIRNCILQKIDQSFLPIVEGHKEELWGLDTLPSQHQFLTCGSDKYIYLWDAQTHSCVWKKQISEEAHCCSIHPELEVAAIGLQTGKWIVLDLSTHEVVAVYHDGKEQHECIQYSPDGKMLAVGNRDNYIYMYDVSDDGKKYHKIGRCSGHSSFVTHLDFSMDGQYLRSNSGDYEVLYWHTKTCKQETQKDDVRDLEWATQNCTLSFDAVGVWPDGADGTDVNNCSVSHNKKLLVSADDYGKVNLYEYPSIQPAATGHIYPGHSSHVTNARFLCDDSRVISTGGRDMSVMQWQVYV
ncbi:echinoderm microtubule-associated protein-like 2 isoform X3 [Mercenaria mercenaria]|uniref:echinoderm microtubule-associated protein-like 2 isoform X3 n=1 Tax=Mercenaria mercenaria TaxID=6596 RepID=UPI00234E9CB7|nr:echinoderm microtubule-associated protein-like 2 isoform X3 [Mercenaria mercenaria]